MQKHAFSNKKGYQTVFTPLPTNAEGTLYFDKGTVVLPYAEDFSMLHYHDRYEIGICESGEGLFFANGIFYSLSAGDVIFVPSGHRHYSRSIHQDVLCQCRFLYCKAEMLIPLLPQAEQSSILESAKRIPTVISADKYPNVAAMLTEMLHLCREKPANLTNMITLRLASFLLEHRRWFSDAEYREEGEHSHPLHAEAAEIAQYLALHYSENTSVEKMAEMCHLSASQLRRQFLASYQMTPCEYRNHLRCNVAAELLRHTVLSVYEIAVQVGYASPSDLYRQFQKKHGVSPSEYRKKCMSDVSNKL